jgi:hypothetical protein
VRSHSLWIALALCACAEPPAPAENGADAGTQIARSPAPRPEREREAQRDRTSAQAGDRVDVRAGTLRAGSLPGTLERRPSVEADLIGVEIPAFSIDRLPYPNDPARPPMLVQSRREAAAVCEREGRRLCGELEWERACKGDGASDFATGDTLDIARCGNDPNACASPFGVLELGIRSLEWTASDAAEPLARLDRTVVVRGALASDPMSQHRCASRQARAPEGGPLAFRCCGGPANEIAYPDVGTRRIFRALEIDDARAREILASVPELSTYAPNFRVYGIEHALAALARGGATQENMTWELAPGPFAWSPSVGEEVFILAGSSGDAALIAAIYPLADGTFLHAASFVFADEAAPLAILRSRGSRRELLWSACWGCSGEGGAVRFDESSRIVIAQQ